MRRGDFFSLGKVIYDPATTRLGPDGKSFVRTAFPGAVLPAQRIQSVSKGFLEFFPLPNAGPGLASNYVDSESRKVNSDQVTMRLDRQITLNDSLFVRYIYTKEADLIPGQFAGIGSRRTAKPQNLSLGDTHVFTPNLLNEFKAGYLRAKSTDFNLNAGRNDVATKLGIQGLDRDPRGYGIPSTAIQDFTTLADSVPNDQANSTFQWIDNVNWNHGRHGVKFGTEIRRFQFNLYSMATPSGFEFDGRFTQNPQTSRDGFSFADFLLGHPRLARRNMGDTQSYFRRSSFNFYLQDDWKIHPRLTLNLGMRYELGTPFTENRDGMITADIKPSGITVVRAGNGSPYEGFPSVRLDPAIRYVRDGRFGAHSVTKTDRNNWSPRIGLAWDPTGKQQWAVRAGLGAFYAEDFANPYFDMARNAPKAIKQLINANPVFPDIRLEQAFGDPKDPLTEPQIFSTQYDLVTPYTLQWSLMIQRQLPGQFVVETGYSGSVSHKLSAYLFVNNAPPGPGAIQPRRRPSPELGVVTPIAPVVNANYHSARLRVEKRLSGGLSFVSAYTWSKAIDDGRSRASAGQGDAAQRVDRLDLERALSDYDIRHIFRLGLTYDLPAPGFARSLLAGWQIGSIFNYLSGNSFTIQAKGDANDGQKNRRANVVSGVDWRLPAGQRSPARWFNTNAFVEPAPFTYGDAGRNIVTGPNQIGLDTSIMRNFTLREDHRLEFRAEMFNLPNHPNFARPDVRSVGVVGFGRLNRALSGRQIQFALKYVF